ncbi:MAG: ribosome silencing factor [Bacteroidia bacterium]|nr:ribosome silencing factor [Bacteroidia bacterium]
MPRKKKTPALPSDPTEKLLATIVKGISDKKGKEIISLDLRKTGSGVCDYFVICHADSTTQVDAIGGNVIEEVRKLTGEKPWHSEGFQNAEWILIDYVNIVVHVFQTEKRSFYNLEKLWGDAELVNYTDEPETSPTLPIEKPKTIRKTTKKATAN